MSDERPTDLPEQGTSVSGRRWLEPIPESARIARRAVVEALQRAGREDLTETASLLVSELVTNAIVHARTPFELGIRAGPDGVHVSVRDGSGVLPQPRHYGRAATTGRGMSLVDRMSDRHGTEPDGPAGKTVWFELGAGPAGGAPDDGAPPSPDTTTDASTTQPMLSVRLDALPVALALAWQQHADALLREYLLSRWDDRLPAARLSVDEGSAHDAFAAVAAALAALAADPTRPATANAVLVLRRDSIESFDALGRLLDHVVEIAESGLLLAPPTQPEIRRFRHWLIEEVRRQAGGQLPGTWPGLPADLEAAPTPPPAWDDAEVRTATAAVLAADDLNRIVAASQAALDLLGWDDDLIGRRLVTVIPKRLREAHIAAFTLTLLTGEEHITGREVTVPARRRDGSEVDIVLLVQRTVVPEGRAIFVATLRPA